MIGYVEHLFNTCPECLPKGRRVLLMHKKGADFSDPCRECGCKFGKIMTPKATVDATAKKAFG